jgi:oligoendopeptidase F
MPTRVHRATTQDDFEPPTVEIDGEAVTLTNPERARLRRSDDRETRRRVYDAIRDAYRDRRATLAATIDAMARRNVRLADERGYESALAAALDDGGGFVACRPADSLSVDSYETLLKGVRSRLDPTHRVDRVIRDSLGVADLREYDRLSSAEARTWTFTEAKETLLASVAPLGDEYRETMATMF